MTKIRYGMVGGCDQSSFGQVHRTAVNLGDDYELVCGAFSRDHEKSIKLNEELQLDPARIYHNYQEMITSEALLPVDQRMQVVSIVTPNHTHFEIAKLALQHGMHIILEKPITLNLLQAKILQALIDEKILRCMVCYTNTGFPMVKQARQMIQDGALGKIKLIHVEYYQGWLANFNESEQTESSRWRCDPLSSGNAGTMADIGIHALNLAEYVSGKNVEKLDANLHSLVPHRQLDDYGSTLLKFQNNIPGSLIACQAAVGEQCHLSIKIYGEIANLKWELENPNELAHHSVNHSNKIYSTIYPHDNATNALANHYHNFAKAVQHHGQQLNNLEDFPSIEEGTRGMAFIETVVTSNNSDKKWLTLNTNFSYSLFENLTKENCIQQLDHIEEQIKVLEHKEDLKRFILNSFTHELRQRNSDDAKAIYSNAKHHPLLKSITPNPKLLFFTTNKEQNLKEGYTPELRLTLSSSKRA